MIKNKIVRKVINNISFFFFGIFYNGEKLRGKHFERSYIGWLWCLKGLPSRLFGSHRKIDFPVHPNTTIYSAKNVEYDNSSLNSFQSPGCYFQNFSGKIIIGKNVWIAPNVGIITANHDVSNLSDHTNAKDVVIEDDVWIGMNAVIMPGVVLKKGTVVGAGSIVTKSPVLGNCLVCGNPASIKKVYEHEETSKK